MVDYLILPTLYQTSLETLYCDTHDEYCEAYVFCGSCGSYQS
jgi:hypothetical protein